MSASISTQSACLQAYGTGYTTLLGDCSALELQDMAIEFLFQIVIGSMRLMMVATEPKFHHARTQFVFAAPAWVDHHYFANWFRMFFYEIGYQFNVIVFVQKVAADY